MPTLILSEPNKYYLTEIMQFLIERYYIQHVDTDTNVLFTPQVFEEISNKNPELLIKDGEALARGLATTDYPFLIEDPALFAIYKIHFILFSGKELIRQRFESFCDSYNELVETLEKYITALSEQGDETYAKIFRFFLDCMSLFGFAISYATVMQNSVFIDADVGILVNELLRQHAASEHATQLDESVVCTLPATSHTPRERNVRLGACLKHWYTIRQSEAKAGIAQKIEARYELIQMAAAGDELADLSLMV